MVRLVFRPYTHVRRTICTSVSLRASIRVSPDFTLHKHSSPSFGSQHRCSCWATGRIQSRRLQCARKGSCKTRFPCASGFATLTLARMLDSLVRVSRRVGSIQQRHDPGRTTTEAVGFVGVRISSTRSWLGKRPRSRAVARRVARPGPIVPPMRGARPRRESCIDSLASNDFTYYFTFFSKSFSSFPHGTCSLSVSRKYLALEGHYLPISAAVPSNTTHGWVI